jgi:oxygen-dependent protoporphyrinogen oxidase
LARVPLDLSRPASPYTRGEVDDVAVGELVAERLGSELLDRLVEPLLGGVYAGRARELSLAATIPALAEAARREASLIRAAASVRAAAPPAEPPTAAPVFASLRGGLGRLPDLVAAATDAQFDLNAPVRAIDRTGTGWRLTVGPASAPVVLTADAVILAVPGAPLARLLTTVVPRAAAAAAEIEYASVGLITLVYRPDDITRPIEGSGFLVPPVERRLAKAGTVLTNKWEWLQAAAADQVIVRCSIGRHREAHVLQRDDADLVHLVERELADFLGVSGHPVASQVTRWGGALPQYAVGHLTRVAAIHEDVATLPGLAVCGDALDGVGVAACVASARAAADRVLTMGRTAA